MRRCIVLAAILCGCSGRVPTWHRDVEPVVARSCAACHVAGGIAPFALGSYADAYQQRDLIRAQVECHWDNSAGNQPDGLPPRDLNWGERTEDEMCLGFLYITQ